jgi:NAD(P)-dependent dehydrogenase (short-subunit alcohol dehydrogenase family)
MANTAGRFAGRTVVVTGGAGGIGRAVSAGFAAEGAAVAVVDTNADAVATTVEQLQQTGGSAGSKGFVVDVRDATAVRQLMADVHAALGGPHLLITLAGGSLGTPRDLADITPDDVELVLGVNVRGTLLCCQAALPYMIDAGGGAIVTVSSIGGRQPSPVTGVPYATAKAAVLGLTRRLAHEVGRHGIRVNAIAPGLVLTDRLAGMVEAMDLAERQSVLDAIPLRRLPELGEIVEPILFLASDAASYITGVVLDVNGGRFMPP